MVLFPHCPTCQKRRIKCDRGLPGCHKCKKRNLECPGYGIQLKWGQGVASRGKLTGQSIPVRESQVETLTNAMVVSGSSASQFTIPSSIDFLRIQPFSPATLGSPATELSLTSPRFPYASQLLAWYKERVAHRLAWIDGPQNPWRQIILPLAENSETVMSSVLALAAHDLASQYPRQDPWFVKFTDISNAFQNKALALLARELSSLTASQSLESRTDASLTLASVIIICNNELLNAASAGWRIHLQAARELILVNTNQTPIIQTELARIQEFLLQEFFSTTVWTHLTTFDDANEPTNNIPQAPTSTEDAAVADFIRIIHLITRLERQKTNSPAPLPPSVIQDTIAQIEAARLKSLRLSDTVTFWSDADRRDFELVVWMFYHANLIYISQAFPELRHERVDVRSSREQILAHVRHLSETRNGMFAQDLVWPLFVAGTELRGDVASQRFVQNAFRDVMRISRTLDRARVVGFLETWWTYEGPVMESWIQLARERPDDFNFLLL
ncbi:hypothetical protein N7470_009526 [Penicillium chermesinum]|nr:hypothetical protein N7470_009526 [Penicillium chermesinum]